MKILLISFLIAISFFGYALAEGAYAPDFSAITLDGEQIDYFDDIRGKQSTFLIFWASW